MCTITNILKKKQKKKTLNNTFEPVLNLKILSIISWLFFKQVLKLKIMVSIIGWILFKQVLKLKIFSIMGWLLFKQALKLK